MSARQSQNTPSPSASSIFLPLGRRGSRASLSTQAEQENLNAALDQIHNAAYQSDSLTVFNEFTNPPAPTATTDENSISGEIQGGLSGLYSRFRGGVRDIVSGVGKQSDKASESSRVKSPVSEHSDARSTAAESQYMHPNSSQGSRLHSPIPGQLQSNQDASIHLGPAKGSKLSSKSASISSKASVSASPAIKSPAAPLSKTTGALATADPTVSELHVNAVKEPLRHSDTLQSMDSTATNKGDNSRPGSFSQSSSRLTHSPVLSAKPHSSLHNEGSNAPDISWPSTLSGQVTEGAIDRHGFSELDTGLPTQKRQRTLDGTEDLTRERLRTGSAASSRLDELNSGPATSSVTQSPKAGNSSLHEEEPVSPTHITSRPFVDGETQAGESSSASAKRRSIEQIAVPSPGRLIDKGVPGTPSLGTISKSTTISPLDTTLDRTPSRSSQNRRPQVSGGDGATPHMRSNLLSKEFWMRDENAKDCFHCGEPFSTFRRKHHCRTCGQIFDSKCTLTIPGTQFGQPGSIRVCKPCEAMINAHDDDSSEFSDSDQSPMAVNPRVSELSFGNARRMSLVDDDDTSSILSQSVDSVMKAPTMAIPATRRAGEGHNRRSAILEISPDRPLARPTSSKSLKSSLSGRPHSIGHKRHHSRQQYIRNFKPYHDERAPFQRRQVEDTDGESRLPAFHKDNIIDPDLAQYLSDDASSGDEQPSLLSAVSESPLSKSSGDNEKSGLGGLFNIMKKGRSAFGDRSTAGREVDEGSIASSKAVNVPRPRRRNLSIASSIRQSPRTSKEVVFSNTQEPSNTGSMVPAMTSTGFKMIRSSSMRGAGAPPVEMNQASLQHVRKLLRQLLSDASIPHPQSWETALLPILLKAADEVDPDVQHGDDMDIRHYIKLKKIVGGQPGDTSYVSGLVFRKNVALKSMPRSIPNPNILIITFPLEYARHQQHFMSLEPVIRQEREFLENLVSRIAALRPNLLLAEKNVSGLALELLEKLNIATAYNVKSSVLEAVSRCTQTKIITSMDKLVTTPMKSECSSFDVKTYVYNRRKKTYMYISGCPKELGCTIVLRGGDKSVLGKVKSITEFMVYVVYNLRLETCVMRDEFAKIPTSSEVEPKEGEAGTRSNTPLLTYKEGDTTSNAQQEPNENGERPALERKLTVTSEETEVPDDVPMPTYYEDMVQDHERKILSASPFVKFEPPHLLMRARELERRLAYLKRLRDQDVDSDPSTDEKTKGQKFILITPEMVHESPQNAPLKVKEVLRAAHDAEYDRALHHYMTQKRQWETYVSGSNSNLFDPYAHQNIAVLFSLVCTTTSIPCSGPDSFAIEFYNEHGDDTVFEPDCTLGQYVEDLCHTANGICTANGCERRMYEHHRQYVHGEAQISVLIQHYPSKLRGLQDSILMWSCCKICGNETQVFPMSDSTWKYSFGKYLELSFWSKNLHARAGVCPHDLQRDHVRYFGFKDMALRIQYDNINLLEIIVPRTRVTWKVDNDLRLRNKVFQKMEQRLNKFMVSVKARLKGINVQSVVPERIGQCENEIELLNRKAAEDQADLLRRLQEKYTNSRYWELIPFNEVLRSAQEKVVEWDNVFTEFEKNYFPSEKDIRRLATLQLKKIFKDASISFAPSEEPATTPAGTDNETNKEDGRPFMMRRMTLSPEKAQDVLVSVVEEHSGKKHRGDEIEPPQVEEVESATPSLDEKTGSSPQEQAVAQKEVRHLDLAVPSGQTEQHAPTQDVPASATNTHEPVPTPDSENPPTSPSQEQAELQVDKPPQEAVEIPGRRTPTTPTPSAIPRLAEAAFRRSGKARSPPLHRAQSQPAHLQKEKSRTGTRLAGIGSEVVDETPNPPHDKPKGSDKKLTERLGLTALKHGRLPSGHSFIPRKRVSNLAKHFEQMTREFEKERQREMQRRAARGTHSRAYPLASSKPIVEVYKNVREAVEEREPSGEGEDFISSSAPRLESSRTSEEFPKRVSEEEPRKALPQLPTEKSADPVMPTEPAEPEEPAEHEDHARTDEAIASDGEHSDEDRISADGLQMMDSNEEIPKMSPDDEPMDSIDFKNHERSTLLKLLTKFWSERSASGWAPLEYPLTMSDHVFADCDIIVREDEPSSLIAFALDSSDYTEKLASIQQRHEEEEPTIGDDAEQKRVEKALLRDTGTHLKYQFQEGQAKMLCKVFYAEQFDALRKKCGVADRIVESLSRCAKWDSKGGKTKSIFLKTLDNRFILKSLAPIETQAFLKFAPGYFQIMSEALFHELPSAIAKMFGFYQVIIKNPATGTEFNWFLLLMENLFYDRVPQRIFDLKGSMRNRKVESTGERNEVLLDENMVDFIYETPLFTREHSKKLLSQSVWNDTLFLGRQNVMDYSLMIAIDESRSELVVGVIDCIRTYTWDKRLESWIKDRGFAGGGKNRPTVTSPKEYKSRFREAMARYVLQAPR